MTRAASPVRAFFRLAFALSWGLGGLGLLVGHWGGQDPSYGVASAALLRRRHAASTNIAAALHGRRCFDRRLRTARYLRSEANLLLAIVVHLMANVCGGFAVDAHALNWFFALEGTAAVLVVGLGGLKARTRRVDPTVTC